MRASDLCAALLRINELLPADDQAVMRAKLRGLMRAYAGRWATDGFGVLEIETLATSDLYNPATSAKSRSFTVAGKKDLLLVEDGRLWLMDHKTTSQDIEDPACAYRRQLVVEGQHHHYGLLEHLNGKRIDGAIWDVTRKPSISPRQITKGEQAQIAATGTWFTDHAEPCDRETPAMYEARVAHDAAVIRPNWYFQRWRIARLDSAMIEYAGELWQHGQDILAARRQSAWVRNSGACLEYGSACKFLGICSGYDEPDSQNWQRVEWVHPELPIIGGNGREVLTNSRVRCWQTCHRKHYYKYELGIERVEAEEREALFFGHVWHEALAVWFEGLKRGQNNDDANSGDSGNEVECAAIGSEGGLR